MIDAVKALLGSRKFFLSLLAFLAEVAGQLGVPAELVSSAQEFLFVLIGIIFVQNVAGILKD